MWVIASRRKGAVRRRGGSIPAAELGRFGRPVPAAPARLADRGPRLVRGRHLPQARGCAVLTCWRSARVADPCLAITHIFPCQINGLLAVLEVEFLRAEPFERPYVV